MPRDYKTVVVPRVDELGGYVTQRKALDLLQATSQVWLHDLTRRGKIAAIRWDNRTLMYDRASIEAYLAARHRGHEG